MNITASEICTIENNLGIKIEKIETEIIGDAAFSKIIAKPALKKEYQRTEIDRLKEQVDLRLISVCPKIVASKLPLKGQGIKPMGKNYQVSDKAWEKLKHQHTWTTDF